MPDPVIRILHTSNWLVGSEGPDPHLRSALDQLIDLLKDSLADYVVISGNVTRSGSVEDFEQARKLIVEFVRKAAREPGNGDFGNRVVLAPGEYDLTVPPKSFETPLTHFNLFAQRVREELGGPQEEASPLSLKAPLVRELKDCTFIVAPYCDLQDFDDDLSPLLTDAAGKLVSLEYRRQTPTILVSSSSPLLTWARRSRLNGQLKSTAEKLGIDFHLFGSSPVFVLPYEPFVYRHVGIATGPRESGELFPLRANLLTLHARDTVHRGDSGESHERQWEFRLSTHEMAKVGESWSEPWAISEPHRFRSLSLTSRSLGDTIELRREIEEWLSSSDADAMTSRVEHVPGSGTREWILSLDGARINGWKVTVKPLTAPGRTDVDRAFRAKGDQVEYDELKETIRAVAREKRTGKHLVVFDDRTYHMQDSEDALKWLQQIWQNVNREVVKDKVKCLYLVTPKVTEGEFRYRFEGLLRVRELKDLSTVLNGHHCTVPFDTKEVERWAGGMVTLANEFLDSSEEVFDSWSGSRELRQTSTSELLNIALGSRRAREMLERCQSAIRRMEGGVDLLQAIAAEFPPERHDAEPPELWLLPTATVEKSSFLVQLLTAQGLLERLDNGRYRVRAASVFTTLAPANPMPPVESETDAETAAGDAITAKHKNRGCDIALFYASEDRDFVDAFAEHLRPVAKRLNMTVWYDQEVQPGSKQDQIERALADCKAAVFFASSHSVDPKRYPGHKELPSLQKRLESDDPPTAFVFYAGPISDDTVVGFFNRLNQPDRTLGHMSKVEVAEVLARGARTIGEYFAPEETGEE
jgi:hypothetical protein